MKVFLIGFFILLFSQVAFSYESNSNTKIKNIRVRPTVAYVFFEGCSRYSKIYLTNDYYKAMLSVALTAAAANKSVAVGFAEGQSCASVEPVVSYIDVRFL